jgi:excisionase family DNA binding protein
VREPLRWIGTAEACRRLGVTLCSLHRLIDEDKLPAYEIGGRIRLRSHEVDEFLERQRWAKAAARFRGSYQCEYDYDAGWEKGEEDGEAMEEYLLSGRLPEANRD